jgi:hypothetical protein
VLLFPLGVWLRGTAPAKTGADSRSEEGKVGTEKSRETKRVNRPLAAYTPQPHKFNHFNKNGLFGRDRSGIVCGLSG